MDYDYGHNERGEILGGVTCLKLFYGLELGTDSTIYDMNSLIIYLISQGF